MSLTFESFFEPLPEIVFLAPAIHQNALSRAGDLAALFREENLSTLIPGTPLSLILNELKQEDRKICCCALELLENAVLSPVSQFIPPLNSSLKDLQAVQLTTSSSAVSFSQSTLQDSSEKSSDDPVDPHLEVQQMLEALVQIGKRVAARKVEERKQLEEKETKEDLEITHQTESSKNLESQEETKKDTEDKEQRKLLSPSPSPIESLWLGILNRLHLRVGSQELERKIVCYQFAHIKASASYKKWIGPEGKIAKAEEEIEKIFQARKEGPEAYLRELQEHFNLLSRIFSDEQAENQLSKTLSANYAIDEPGYDISIRPYRDIVFKALNEALSPTLLQKSGEPEEQSINLKKKESKEILENCKKEIAISSKSKKERQEFYFLELFQTVAKWNGKEVVMRKKVDERMIREKFEHIHAKIQSAIDDLTITLQEHTERLNSALWKKSHLQEKKVLCELKFRFNEEV